MMLRLLAAILALVPAQALADVTARYSMGKDVLTVEVDDGGNSRLGIEGMFSLIRRDGYDYVVMIPPGGEAKVTELGALMQIMAGAMQDQKPPAGMFPEPKFALVSKGDVTVGGRAGTLWSFGPMAQPGDPKPQRAIELTMSADPALAPVGEVFRRTVMALLPQFSAIVPESSGFAPQAAELMAKGTPLRIDKKFELQSVETAEIDPKRFELPAPVISAVEFMTAMEPGGGGGGVEFNPLP